MNRFRGQNGGFTATAAVCFGMAAVGCSGAPDAGSPTEDGVADTAVSRTGLLPEHERAEIAPMVPADWVGHKVGASPGRWRYAGQMRLAGPDDEVVEPVLDEDAPSVPGADSKSMILGDPDTGAMYEIEMEDFELAKVAKVLAAAGYTAPSHAEVGMDRDLPGEKGWSNGVDNRSDLGDGAFAQDTWPYRTIGQLKVNGTAETSNGNCTATFVGSAGDANERYILTASHCLWAVGGAYNDPDFWPRQDRCLTNQGAAIAGCDQGPYGEWDGGQWLMYTFFINNCAGLSSLSTDCQNNDIAIMRVHRQSGASFPGAQGFAYWSKTDLDGVSKFHRGYPNCAGAGDPVPVAPTVCLPRTLYGDGAFTIGNGLSVDGDGWPRRYDYSADISPGHSGGPSYFSSGGNHYVFGVASVETCSGSACTAARPNRMRAVTEHWFNEMLGFMGL